MRWILCGKNDAAAASLELLAERGDRVLAVATAGDEGRDGWRRSFRGAARRCGAALEAPPRINDPAFLARLADFGADALLSIQYDQILSARLLEGVGCPCLNFHFALLPRHRGVAPLAWAILDGDAEAGVTLHHMVAEIDAGDVIARRAVPVGAETTARELYDGVSRLTVELFAESYPFGPELLGRRLPQDAGRASYHRRGDLDFADRRADWKRPAAELQRWLRALIFPPLQLPETALRDRRLCIGGVAGAPGPATDAAAGTVLERSGAGVAVACADRALWITGLTDPARPELSSAAVLAGVEPGDELG